MDVDLIELGRVVYAILEQAVPGMIVTERPILRTPEGSGFEGPIFPGPETL